MQPLQVAFVSCEIWAKRGHLLVCHLQPLVQKRDRSRLCYAGILAQLVVMLTSTHLRGGEIPEYEYCEN